jgi:hypothetical protein
MRHSSSGEYVIGISGRKVNELSDRFLAPNRVGDEGARRFYRIHDG